MFCFILGWILLKRIPFRQPIDLKSVILGVALGPGHIRIMCLRATCVPVCRLCTAWSRRDEQHGHGTPTPVCAASPRTRAVAGAAHLYSCRKTLLTTSLRLCPVLRHCVAVIQLYTSIDIDRELRTASSAWTARERRRRRSAWAQLRWPRQLCEPSCQVQSGDTVVTLRCRWYTVSSLVGSRVQL